MKLVAALSRVAGANAGLPESNSSLPPGLWLTYLEYLERTYNFAARHVLVKLPFPDVDARNTMDAISDTEGSDDSATPIQCIVDYTSAPTRPVRYMLMYAGRIDRCNAVWLNNTSRVASLPTTKQHGPLLRRGMTQTLAQSGGTQWCIAKNGGGYTQRGAAKGLKLPCLFMITEVSIRCQNNPEVGIRRIPAYTTNTPLVIGISVSTWRNKLYYVDA